MLVPNRPRCSKNCKTNSRFTASSLRSYSISNRKINILTTVKRIDIKLSPHPCLPHILSGRTGERHIVKANERGGLRWPEMDPEKHDVISIRVTEHHLEEPVDTAEQGHGKPLEETGMPVLEHCLPHQIGLMETWVAIDLSMAAILTQMATDDTSIGDNPVSQILPMSVRITQNKLSAPFWLYNC